MSELSIQAKTPWRSKEEWFRLPLELRRKWWRETDYSNHPASAELIAECKAALENPDALCDAPYQSILTALRDCADTTVRTWVAEFEAPTTNPLIVVERLRGKSLHYREQLRGRQRQLKKYLNAIEDACDTAHFALGLHPDADRWRTELVVYERAEYQKDRVTP